MSPDLLNSQATLDVHLQAAAHEALQIRAESNLGLGNLAGLRGFGVDERAFPRAENGEEDTEGPDFGAGGLIRLAAEDFGGGVGDSAVAAIVEGERFSRVVDDR